MKERPMLFSGPMVRAILEGRKTQTRRVLKPQPCELPDFNVGQLSINVKGSVYGAFSPDCPRIACQYGKSGDRLWVREQWRVGAWSNFQEIAVDYMADNCCGQEWIKCESEELFDRLVEQSITDSVEAGYAERDGIVAWNPGNSPCRKRPSIHMPRWASRITLEITGIRVERLQEISCDDAIAEGIEREYAHNQYLGWKNYLWHGHFGEYGLGNKRSDQWDHQYSTYRTENPVGSYSSLWESINGPGSWDANPWVWVIEFRRINP